MPTRGGLFKRVFRAGAGMPTERLESPPGATRLTGARADLYVAAKAAHSEDDDLTAYVRRLAQSLNARSGLGSAPRRPEIERALYRLILDGMSEADAVFHLAQLHGDSSRAPERA